MRWCLKVACGGESTELSTPQMLLNSWPTWRKMAVLSPLSTAITINLSARHYSLAPAPAELLRGRRGENRFKGQLQQCASISLPTRKFVCAVFISLTLICLNIVNFTLFPGFILYLVDALHVEIILDF